MDKKRKISSTAYRVLVLLQKLSEGRCNVDNLNTVFSSDEYTSRYFSREVILKYISTLRTAGYDILKPTITNNYNYELNKSPVSIEINSKQIETIAKMNFYAKSFHQDKIVENYNNFLKKIKKFIPENQLQLLNKEMNKQQEVFKTSFFKHAKFEKLIKKIEKFKTANQRVSVKFKNPDNEEIKQVTLELKNIKYDKNEVYISGYNPTSEQTISIKIKNIVNIKQLPTKSQYKQILFPVIFRLKGQLAKVYKPYENEKVSPVEEKADSLTVTAYIEDYEALIKRLLKYGENCEIVYPKHAQNYMVKIINKTLQNYE